jgi:hypothetical protein
VEVHDVGAEGVDDGGHAPLGGTGPQDAAGGPGPARKRRRLELDVVGEVGRVPGGAVVGVVHPEEVDVVPGRHLQGGEVLHVGLGAALAVQELVDVENAHLSS